MFWKFFFIEIDPWLIFLFSTLCQSMGSWLSTWLSQIRNFTWWIKECSVYCRHCNCLTASDWRHLSVSCFFSIGIHWSIFIFASDHCILKNLSLNSKHLCFDRICSTIFSSKIYWMTHSQIYANFSSNERDRTKFVIFSVNVDWPTIWIFQCSSTSGIIYCRTRDACSELASRLSQTGKFGHVKYYHAGLANEKRLQIQQEWMNGQTSIICATISFGMGIDKSDVRLVIWIIP